MSQQSPVPTITLATVKQQFKEWRDSRQHRSRIPEELWEAAASLSGQYSIHYFISKSLGVNHSSGNRGQTPILFASVPKFFLCRTLSQLIPVFNTQTFDSSEFF